MKKNALISKARNITATLFAAQSLGSAGWIGVATLASIIGADLGGKPSWAGVPPAIALVGGAGGSFLWGKLMDILGRRNGLVLGLLLGVIGASLALTAVEIRSMLLFLIGMALMGVAYAALMLGRFAAAEVNLPEARGRAISTVVLGGAIGAILGPLLVDPSGNFMTSLHFNPYSGVFLVGAVLFAIAALVVFFRLRPDPLELGKMITDMYPEKAVTSDLKRSLATILQQPKVFLAMLTMTIGQMVMIMVMVITGLHMKDHQHTLSNISLVYSIHAVGMFGFSIISGRLSDRLGRGRVILFGAINLALACFAASLSPHLLPLSVALFLLGLGWNFCFVGGSALLADQLLPLERARIQGINDFFVGIGSTLGSLGSGVVFAFFGYGFTTTIGVILAILLIVVVGIWQKNQSGEKTLESMVAS